MPTRRPSLLDSRISLLGRALATISGSTPTTRPSPASSPDPTLETADRALSGALMRVNHVGEICAQALYESQALTARDPQVARGFRQAAREEGDHLAWTRQRLDELGDRPSLLNPLWYGASFAIGLLAGRLGDPVSLGFMAETEKQVEAHLTAHLDRLPAADLRSREVVRVMVSDERGHAEQARARGAATLPSPVRGLMRLASRVMTSTAHHI